MNILPYMHFKTIVIRLKNTKSVKKSKKLSPHVTICLN